MDCEYCNGNRDYMRVLRQRNEAEERLNIARKIIQDQRKGIITEDLVRDVLKAHAKVLKKAPKEDVVKLITEELNERK